MGIKIEDHNDLCVGIDLGTTNSVLATINEKPNGDVVSKPPCPAMLGTTINETSWLAGCW